MIDKEVEIESNNEQAAMDDVLLLFREHVDEMPTTIFRAAKLTRNGKSSLIVTIPQEIWQDANIDHENPQSVGIYYSTEEKKAVMDFGR